MAGIEKVCEYSGESRGARMYGWKRDLIQVLPEYRRLFKRQDALLIFGERPLLSGFDDSPNVCVRVCRVWMPTFWTRYYWQSRRYGFRYRRELQAWDYLLYVPGVQGQVRGRYCNYTLSPERAVARLARLVGRLDVWSVPFDVDSDLVEGLIKEWEQANENT